MARSPVVPILMLHKVAPCPSGTLVPGHYVSPALFQRQLGLLKRLGYRSVGLNRLFEERLPSKPIVITFDDGYENYYSNALPLLEQSGYSATVFVVSNLVGDVNRWDAERGDHPERLMDLPQILDAIKRGTEIGSHTLSHADLSSVGEEEAWRQIHESKLQLEKFTLGEVRTFCYPYGRKSQATEELVRRAGYRFACSTVGGVNTPASNPFSLKRVNVRKDTSPAVLLYKLLRDSRRG